MPDFDELKEKVRLAEQRLIVLARQNTEYNAEIVKLKSAKDKACSDYEVALKDLERAVNDVSMKQNEFIALNSEIEKQKSELSSIESSRILLFENAAKEKESLTDIISRLRADKVAIENEIASLQTKLFNARITINTQNFTIEDNNLRVNKVKSELSSVEMALNVSNMELSSIENKIKDRSAELQAKIDILEFREKELAVSIDAKSKELSSIQYSIASEREAFEADIKKKKDALSEEKKSVDEAKKVNEQKEKANAELRQALADREQELKLLELKIRELARKKDIDAQIASLSK